MPPNSLITDESNLHTTITILQIFTKQLCGWGREGERERECKKKKRRKNIKRRKKRNKERKKERKKDGKNKKKKEAKIFVVGEREREEEESS